MYTLRWTEYIQTYIEKKFKQSLEHRLLIYSSLDRVHTNVSRHSLEHRFTHFDVAHLKCCMLRTPKMIYLQHPKK